MPKYVDKLMVHIHFVIEKILWIGIIRVTNTIGYSYCI